ncbi:ABC transporter permease [Aneurinibacillus tyrosinisolvens]|uniref:ABC transporter permease n=1 Tax=Aneurinibacillus tyrosinisolvens TaxID=1443435 RepID=UPI00063FCD34|nr:ABC transporter permease subunit [Aneurinibacillus tyrosinisolvens]
MIQRMANPVLSKELRLRMRSKRTPWAIVFYLAALGGIAFTFIFMETQGRGYYSPSSARTIFIMLCILQFALVAFVTPGLTAGVISGERERQTLNILLTTNLSPAKIIFGKWLSSLSFMILLVLSSIPLYSIVFLFGGISPGQLVQVFGVYIVTMLAIGAVGVLVSTLIKRTGVATVVTYAIIFGYTAGITVLIIAIQQMLMRTPNQGYGPPKQLPVWDQLLVSFHPAVGLFSIFGEDAFFGPVITQLWKLPISPYWVFMIFYIVIAIVCISLAIYFVRPVRRRLFKK